MTQKTAVLIGNTDGIGLAATRLLLGKGYAVTGISRSASLVSHAHYTHIVQDVAQDAFEGVLRGVLADAETLDVCIYFAGIGFALDPANMAQETRVFKVNLMAAVIATELAVTEMMKRGGGHFIGLSSVMDVAISPKVPSYSASKAGVSKFWDGLGLGLAGQPVKVSNVRFGFVDTKMADAPWKPFLQTPEEAAGFIFDVMQNPRPRATKPRIMGLVSWLFFLPVRLKLLLF